MFLSGMMQMCLSGLMHTLSHSNSLVMDHPKVITCIDKQFTINISGQQEVVSLDRLKSAHTSEAVLTEFLATATTESTPTKPVQSTSASKTVSPAWPISPTTASKKTSRSGRHVHWTSGLFTDRSFVYWRRSNVAVVTGLTTLT